MNIKTKCSNGIILERLSVLLESNKSYDPNFLSGIKEGEIIEQEYKKPTSLPETPEISNNKIGEYEWEILIDADKYIDRAKNKYFEESFNNDFDEILKIVNELNKDTNKKIVSLKVKPKIYDDSFLQVLAEIIRSRYINYGCFKSEFLDGFSEGKWRLDQIQETISPIPLPSMLNRETNMNKSRLLIEVPFEYYKHKVRDNYEADDYILKVANEIKHFSVTINSLDIKPL